MQKSRLVTYIGDMHQCITLYGFIHVHPQDISKKRTDDTLTRIEWLVRDPIGEFDISVVHTIYLISIKMILQT